MFKLCPIEPTDEKCIEANIVYINASMCGAFAPSEKISAVYNCLTAECQTVEILPNINQTLVWAASQGSIEYRCHHDPLLTAIADHLTQNGYQIIKVKDDE